MKKKTADYELFAELLCGLTRNCSIREEYFAASFNLSPTEVRFLKLFAFKEVYTIKELREALGLTPGRITHILTSLEKKKLLTRTQDESDKRNIIVTLLPKSKPLIGNLHQNYNRLHKEILKSVSNEDMNKIYDSLEILVDKFSKWAKQK